MPRLQARITYCLTLALLLSTVLGLILMTSTQRVRAFATITVTNTDDSGSGSLRQAIADAASGDTITFSALFNSPQTITLGGTELFIDKSLTITGPGANLLTVSGNNASRVFQLAAGSFDVTLSGLTMANGRVTDFNVLGGGILKQSTGMLNIMGSTLSGNSASGTGGFSFSFSSGGGLYAAAGTVNVINSTISGNSASSSQGSSGGGIYAATGTVNVTNSTISGNSASALVFSIGGGIYANGGTVNVTNSTISGNSASASGSSGGGISCAGTVNVTNSTISGNSASASAPNVSTNVSFGGGIAAGVTVNLTNSTISGNSAAASNGSTNVSAGGGIFNFDGTVNTKNTIIAKNTALNGPDVLGTFTSQGYNLIGDGTDSTGFTGTGDQVGTSGTPIDPLLGPLQNNGGPTMTHSLQCTSPALDKGKSFVLTTDQRGDSRPVDLADSVYPNAVGGDAADIGAYETQTGGCTPTAVPPNPQPSTLEDTAVTIALTGTYPQNTNLTFTITEQPSHSAADLTPISLNCVPVSGVLCISTFDYTPAANYFGPDLFKFKVSAGALESEVVQVDINVISVNDPPVASNDVLSDVPEDSGTRTIPLANLLANDSFGPANEGGQTLNFIPVGGSGVGGTISSDAINLYFTPAADYNGPASFQYFVTDNGTTNSVTDPRTSGLATVSFSITEVNDAPTAANDSLGDVAEDSGEQTIPFSTLVSNDSKGPANESGQTLIVKTVSNPVGGTVSIVAGTIRFTPTADYNGQASFQYTAEDNGTTNGLVDPKTSGPAIASFNITPVADTPLVTPATTNEDTQTTSGLVIARNTVDGAEVTNCKITNITNGALFQNNGTTQINDGDFITIAQGGAGLKFTPAANLSSPSSNFSFQAQASLNNTNGGLGGGLATATITVNPINDSPTVDAISNLITNEDAPVQTVNLTGISAGGGESQTLVITATSNNPGLIPNPAVNYTSPNATGSLSFAPAANQNGSALLTITVNDSGGTANGGVETVVLTFTVTVNAVNDAPSFTIGLDQTASENSGARTINPWLTNISKGPADEAGQTLTFQVTNNTNAALFSLAPAISSTGTLTYAAAANTSGTAAITIVLKDNGGVANGGVDTSAPQTFNITVNDGGTLQFSAATYGVAENAGPAAININRVGGTAGTATVQFATSNGTATAADYTSVSQTVTFNEGETTKTVNVPISDDMFNEPDETVSLTLNSVGGSAQVGTLATAVLTILNDDPIGGYVKFSSPDYSVSESGGTTTITVERLGTLSQAVTVDYATSDDSTPAIVSCASTPGNTIASSRCDFSSAFGKLSFAAGNGAPQTFNVLINQDSYVEGPESLSLTLSNLTGSATFATPSTSMLTINDDVSEPPTNAVDDATTFVRAHYHDFLNREPDPAGLAFWTNEIASCGANAHCTELKRINVSAAFFLSIEFQATGGTAYLTNKVAFGGLPTYVRFETDVQALGGNYVFGQPGADANLEANKLAFFNDYVSRTEFTNTYNGLSDRSYVNALTGNTGVSFTLAEHDALVNGLANHTETRATVLRKITEKPSFMQAEFSPMFVLMEYFGFLRRNPDAAGYDFWLNKLNGFNGNFIDAEMVKALLSSGEYRQRFGP